MTTTKTTPAAKAPRKPKAAATVTDIKTRAATRRDFAKAKAEVTARPAVGTVTLTDVGTDTPAVETPESIAAMSKVARINLSKIERQNVAAWKTAGSDPANKPSTPVLDWMNGATQTELKGKAKSTTGRTSTKTFTAAEHADGFECDTCHTVKPVTQFPTVKGPGVRATRCRTCRDAAKASA